MQGKYPVIYLTFKDLKHNRWEDSNGAFRFHISREFGRHRYLMEGDVLTSEEKAAFESVLKSKAELSLYESALFSLSEYLYRFHGQKVVILIEEYDTPIYSACMAGYYNELITFIRNQLASRIIHILRRPY